MYLLICEAPSRARRYCTTVTSPPSQRCQQLAEAVDRAGDLAAPHRAPDSRRDHCGILAPVAAMTSAHFLVSACMIVRISADELPNTSSPCSVRRSFNLASATAFLTSLTSRSTTLAGVLAGASNPNQPASS